MNDYIAKPVDERLLYSKIIGLVKKSSPATPVDEPIIAESFLTKEKCIDLAYLTRRTKSNPALMMEMIAVYLEQTPPLIVSMKESLASKKWDVLQATIHKMIPSFSIMGIHTDFEKMAIQVKEYASSQQNAPVISEMVSQLEHVCTQACIELKEAFTNIKAQANDK
jgi:hypothetical protein